MLEMIPPDERPSTPPTQLTYRERWMSVVFVGGAWASFGAILIAMRADWFGVGKVVAIGLAMVAATVAFRFRVAVVLNADRILVRTWTTRAYAWTDISSIVMDGPWVAVTTPSGTAHLPLTSTTPGPGEGAPALGQAVWAAWIERRGDPWFPPPLDSWSPPRDLDDRVVLRNLFRQRAVLMFFLVPFVLPQLVDPTVPITDGVLFVLTSFGVAAGLLVLVQRRVALIIGKDEIVVRWLFGSRCIPRSIVVGVDLEPPNASGGSMAAQQLALWRGGSTAPQRVRILTTEGYEPVSVPASGGIVLGHDPVFFRKLGWLDRTLRAPADSAAGPAADR